MPTAKSSPVNGNSAGFMGWTWVFKAAGWLSLKTRPNPYPYYRWLRRIRPMLRLPGGFWMVTSYDEANAILRDRRFTVPVVVPDATHDSTFDEQRARLVKMTGRILLNINPPDHTRIRGLMSRAFTAKAINSLRPRIQAICDALLEAMAGRRTIDLIAEFAFPFPITVIAEMLGVPSADRDRFRRWSRHLIRVIEPINDPALLKEITTAATELRDYFAALVAKRRKRPDEDILTLLSASGEQGDRLNEDELLSNLMLLLIAGHETTTNLIGNGALTLLRNPEQLAKLRADPSLIATTVEELLRFESPIQVSGRTAGETVQINGRTIAKGEAALVMIGAANRDPEKFADPDKLDITRKENDHLAFGGGIHYCLGANLARLEAQIAISRLLQRSSKLSLIEDRPQWRDNINLRSLESLHVAV